MKPTILVVDDYQSTLEILTSIFNKDFNIESKLNGQEALIWMEKGHLPDLIITDIVMPVMDGTEFLKQLKSSGLFREIPVVILSGLDDSIIRVQHLRLGADDFINKPFNPDELQIRVENILKRYHKV